MFSRVDNYLNTIKEITKKYNGKICIDIANGYIPNLINFVKEVREK